MVRELKDELKKHPKEKNLMARVGLTFLQIEKKNLIHGISEK